MICILLCVSAVASGQPAEESVIRDRDGEELPNRAIQRLGTRRFRYAGSQKRCLFVPVSNQLVVGGTNSSPEIFSPTTGKRIRHAAPGAAGNSLFAASQSGDLAVLTTQAEFVDGAHPVELRIRKGKAGTVVTWSEPPSTRLRLFALSPDAELTVTVTAHGKMVLRRARSSEILAVHEIGFSGMEALDWSPDGKRVALATRKHVWLWDVTSEEEPQALDAFGALGAEAVCFSNDSSRLAVANLFRPEVGICDVVTKEKVATIACDPAASNRESIRFSIDDTTLFVPNRHKRTVDAFDAKSGRRLHQFFADRMEPRHIDLSSDGKLLAAVGPHDRIVVWNVETQEQISGRFPGHDESICAVTFTNDNTEVVTAETNGMLRLWDVKSGDRVRTFPADDADEGHSSIITSLAVGAGKQLASSARDNTVRIWDLNTGDQKLVVEGYNRWGAAALAFNENGSQLVSFGEGGLLRRWNTTTGDRAVPDKQMATSFRFAWFGHHAEMLGRHDAIDISLFDSQTGIRTLHRKAIDGIRHGRISPDGKTVALGHTNRAGRIRVAANQPRRDQFQLRLYDAKGELDIPLHKIPLDNYLSVVRFSSDSQLVAAGSARFGTEAGTIVVFDMTSRKVVAKIKPGSTATHLSFSHDNRFLVTAMDDKSALVWDLEAFRADLSQ